MDSTASKSSGGKTLAVLLVVALIVLVVVLDMRRRQAESKLMELSMQYEQQGGNEAQNRENAKQIVDKVRRLINIPSDVEPTVATIVDVEQLRQRNAFYNKAKNGDHLIVTQDRAILYDPVADRIIDVVPVQIQAPTPASAAGSPAARASSAAARNVSSAAAGAASSAR